MLLLLLCGTINCATECERRNCATVTVARFLQSSFEDASRNARGTGWGHERKLGEILGLVLGAMLGLGVLSLSLVLALA